MEIYRFDGRREIFLELLLSADEQESMLRKYMEKGDMFILDDDGIKGECIVTCEGDGVYEIKNIAVYPQFQRQGYAEKIINYIPTYYRDCRELYVGTGDSPLTIPFYEKCGFKRSHIVKDFFTQNYDRPIFENGVQLKDMVYLKKEICSANS
ncbi:GNAT family N-acetyltransferase [Anaerotignum faecicola]|nr:GNAT family N-acetyltransferase [Anaerotignum faecicola]